MALIKGGIVLASIAAAAAVRTSRASRSAHPAAITDTLVAKLDGVPTGGDARPALTWWTEAFSPIHDAEKARLAKPRKRSEEVSSAEAAKNLDANDDEASDVKSYVARLRASKSYASRLRESIPAPAEHGKPVQHVQTVEHAVPSKRNKGLEGSGHIQEFKLPISVGLFNTSMENEPTERVVVPKHTGTGRDDAKPMEALARDEPAKHTEPVETVNAPNHSAPAQNPKLAELADVVKLEADVDKALQGAQGALAQARAGIPATKELPIPASGAVSSAFFLPVPAGSVQVLGGHGQLTVPAETRHVQVFEDPPPLPAAAPRWRRGWTWLPAVVVAAVVAAAVVVVAAVVVAVFNTGASCPKSSEETLLDGDGYYGQSDLRPFSCGKKVCVFIICIILSPFILIAALLCLLWFLLAKCGCPGLAKNQIATLKVIIFDAWYKAPGKKLEIVRSGVDTSDILIPEDLVDDHDRLHTCGSLGFSLRKSIAHTVDDDISCGPYGSEVLSDTDDTRPMFHLNGSTFPYDPSYDELWTSPGRCCHWPAMYSWSPLLPEGFYMSTFSSLIDLDGAPEVFGYIRLLKVTNPNFYDKDRIVRVGQKAVNCPPITPQNEGKVFVRYGYSDAYYFGNIHPDDPDAFIYKGKTLEDAQMKLLHTYRIMRPVMSH